MKRMKLPNGFGNISKLSGNRRRPWRVRKTVGWKEDENTGQFKQQFVTIGYYETRSEAYEALVAYNSSPYDLSNPSMTFSEVYEKWSAEHFENIVPSAIRTWKSAYSYCEPLYSMKFRDIRASHLEGTIRNADVGGATKGRMKSLFNLMYKYAMKHELADKNYAELCESVKRAKPKIERIPFTSEEIQLLKKNIDFPFVDMVLIGIYSAWRPQELSVLKTADINIDDKFMRGGLKTEAGKNRIVPIHADIIELIKKRYEEAKSIQSEYLFNDLNGQQGTFMTYDKYRSRFNKIMKRFKLEHKPHDTRHTFITAAKNCNMNEYILKLIVGHAINDVTEDTYTHRTLSDLEKEMSKLHF